MIKIDCVRLEIQKNKMFRRWLFFIVCKDMYFGTTLDVSWRCTTTVSGRRGLWIVSASEWVRRSVNYCMTSLRSGRPTNAGGCLTWQTHTHIIANVIPFFYNKYIFCIHKIGNKFELLYFDVYWIDNNIILLLTQSHFNMYILLHDPSV